MYENYEKEEMYGGKTHKSVRSINKAIRELKQKAKTMKSAKKGGKRKGNAWTRLVTKTYKKHHKKNSKYTLKDAIRDAKSQYKKGGEYHEPEEMTNHEEMIEGGKDKEKMGGMEEEEE